MHIHDDTNTQEGDIFAWKDSSSVKKASCFRYRQRRGSKNEPYERVGYSHVIAREKTASTEREGISWFWPAQSFGIPYEHKKRKKGHITVALRAYAVVTPWDSKWTFLQDNSKGLVRLVLVVDPRTRSHGVIDAVHFIFFDVVKLKRGMPSGGQLFVCSLNPAAPGHLLRLDQASITSVAALYQGVGVDNIL
jgi:hypothetical protein